MAETREILRAAKAHGAGSVRVFGSVARGEAVAGTQAAPLCGDRSQASFRCFLLAAHSRK